MKVQAILCLILAGLLSGCVTYNAFAEKAPEIGLYRLFETSVKNDNSYANKFADIELTVIYTGPSGKTWDFWGFYDGDGDGSGDLTTGNVWKMRFMPNELGTWNYTYNWSDGTPGGKGRFECVEKGASKGMLQPYKENPYWFAYNGTEPVWIKSYYETGHGSIAQDFDWITENVYQPLVDRGYNHLQVNWLLSLCCFGQYYKDGPEPSTQDLTLYEEGLASSTMRLDVWQMLERHLGWLNERNVGVHMFLGFEGERNDGPKWEALSDDEKDFYVRYTVARIGPYANLAGWNFVWEVPGDRKSHELGLARLLQKYDIFNHLCTYEDEMPREHEYDRPEYNFAAIENHRIVSAERELDKFYWKTPWTHHQACLLGSVPGKPVYMSEGNALWRRYWHEKSGADQNDLRRAAWACVTAGASFCWNGHAKEYELYVRGPEGMPFHGDDNPYTVSAKYIDILSDVMSNEVVFQRMIPKDDVLTGHDLFRVWCLAETGKQYLVFSSYGEPFSIILTKGTYKNNIWLDTKTGKQTKLETVSATGDPAHFNPPNRDSDWVLIVRK